MGTLITRLIFIYFQDISSENSYKIRAQTHICVDPASEIVVWGKVLKILSTGLQGVCNNNAYLLQKGLLLAKTLVTIPTHHQVPLRILNSFNEFITIPKESVLSDFNVLGNDYHVISDKLPSDKVKSVNSILYTGMNHDNFKFDTFMAEFKISESLTLEQQHKLSQCLFQNNDLFVAKTILIWLSLLLWNIK